MSANFAGPNPGQRVQGKSRRLRLVNPTEVLTELYALLEKYGPSWYAGKQHDRALDARRPTAEVLLELVTLLEEYAPTWYTEKQRGRAFDALRVPEVLANKRNMVRMNQRSSASPAAMASNGDR